MDLILRIFFIAAVVCKYGQCQDHNITVSQLPTANVSEGDSFILWCNVTSNLSTSQGYQVLWNKGTGPDSQWCSGISNGNEQPRLLTCDRPNAYFNASDDYAIGLTIPFAQMEDMAVYRCAFGLLGGHLFKPLEGTEVFVVKRPPTTAATTITTQTATKGPSTKGTQSPSTPGLSKEIIIAIGAGGGAGVLLLAIIVAVVCVKKKGKGNSTSDIDERRSNYGKTSSFEKNAENIYTNNKRKSHPLDKNVENLHYADLTLHDNPRSPSSKGTGSAKSKTLTVNPGDDRVEYAAVMAS